MYDIEKIYLAKDVKDALMALEADTNAIVISGGSDILIKIRKGGLAGASLVSIHGMEELRGIEIDGDGTIIIRPGTSFSQIANNQIVMKYIPILGNAVDQIGGPQIRNIGTIGGNVCNGVTSADSASSLFVLNAVLELTSLTGVRQMPISEFYTGPGKTVRQHGELLTAIRITKENYQGFHGHYIKYGKRNAMEIATLGCAALVKLNQERNSVEELRLAYGVAAPTPVRCKKTEEMAKGRKLSGALLEAVGKGALEEVHPRSSWRASREFRLQLVEELGKRALRQAVLNSGGEINA